MKNTPIRCFAGNAKPHEPFWQIRNAADGSAEIVFDGPISEYSWLGDEITPQLFANDLKKLGGRDVTLRINSPGGDPIAASRMRAALTDYPGKVTARIDGICASAATLVALAANKVVMQDSAFFMIHDPSLSLMAVNLDIATMESMLGALKTVKGSLIDSYESRTGISRERIGKMMSEETWFSASEAVKFGFADDVLVGGVKASTGEHAPREFTNLLVSNFVNVPAALVGVPGRQEHLPLSAELEVEEAEVVAEPTPEVVDVDEPVKDAPSASSEQLEMLQARAKLLKRSK